MGRIFHAEDKANGYVEEIHSEISRAQMYAKGKPPQLAMMLEVGGRNIFNYDDGWIIGDMIRQMGGVMPVKARKLSSEQLIEYDPDVILWIISWKAKRRIYKSFSMHRNTILSKL